MRKLIIQLASIILVTASALLCIVSNTRNTQQYYLFNAYAPGYDEYFVIKSPTWLPLDTIVHFDEQATVTEIKTGYQAKILSVYSIIK